jgi:branched-chain amino acid transport system ATP-binding protein
MALEVAEVDVSYGKKQVLRGVALRVEPKEIVALIGHNGAGKTTLLRAIIGALRVQRGRIAFDGQPLANGDPQRNVQAGVVYCPQGGQVFRTLTVEENLGVAAMVRPRDARGEADAARVYALFPRLAERRTFKGGVLSGGERQMLAIGMALMAGPRLLLVDEPSGGLAPLYVDRLFEAIVQINREYRAAILLVEQNFTHALGVAHRVYVMRNGAIADSGTPAALRERLQETFFGFEAALPNGEGR